MLSLVRGISGLLTNSNCPIPDRQDIDASVTLLLVVSLILNWASTIFHLQSNFIYRVIFDPKRSIHL